MTNNQITVKSNIKAAVEKVWDCYTNPKHIVNWNFASPEWCCPTATNELKQGGRYMARMESKDGSMGFDFEAIYSEVVPLKKLCYTMGDDVNIGRKAIVIFEQIDHITEVKVSFDPEDENSIELQKNGWQAILDNFKGYVESLA